MADLVRFDVAAFRNWLASIYDAGPGAQGAVAIASIVDGVFEKALEIRRGLSPGDAYMQRALEQWDDDAKSFEVRRRWYQERIAAGDYDAVRQGVLNGTFPIDGAAALPPTGRRGLAPVAGGHYVDGMSDAATVASLANQVFELVPEDAYLGGGTLFGDALRSALTYSASELEKAPAGEDPTVRDKVEDAAGAAWESTRTAVGAAASAAVGLFGWGIMVPIGIGIGVVGLGYLLIRKL